MSETQSNSRQVILDRLKGCVVDAPELPTIDPARVVQFDDRLQQFQETLASVGGEAHLVDTPSEIHEKLQAIEVFQSARRIASTVPEAVTALDWTIVRGEFGVAENGAIWIDGKTLPHRVMIFIAQYLAIVISRSDLLNNMHEAYARIGAPGPGFGVFVSGPSKTADIEQSLVLGAHGCRKLQVFLLP